MKNHLLPAALLLLNGCQTPAPVVVRESAPAAAPAASRDAEIARILDLKARGVISDAQAVQIINAMVSDNVAASGAPASGASPATPTTKPTTVNATAAVAATGAVPAPAPVPAAPVPVAAASAATPAAAMPVAAETKPALDARYQPRAVLSGRLRSIGSDTMDLLVARWEEIFTQYHPGLKVLHEGRGSSTATPSLVEGQSDFGPMSRAMQGPEIAKFQERFGYAPTQVRVAIDALGLYVHPSNPVAQLGLTLEQVDAIFSATRKRGGAERLSTWGQLGVGGAWANAPINVYGRNKASGTYGFFRDSALSKGEFGEWVDEQVGSAQVVEKVTADKFGIGYSGVGYKTDGVALAPVVVVVGEHGVEPSEETALSGEYPLARPLFIVTNRNPAAAPSDLQREFLGFVLGPIGQEVVKREGYYPLPPKLLAEEQAKLR